MPTHRVPPKGYAQISVLVNSAPFGGYIVASPTAGTAALDTFYIASLGWTDEVDDLPLAFGFSYANGQVRVDVSVAFRALEL